MAAIMTTAGGTLAYWDSVAQPLSQRVFGGRNAVDLSRVTGFARLSSFAANRNHAPADLDGAVTWDAGIDLLFRIAGARR